MGKFTITLEGGKPAELDLSSVELGKDLPQLAIILIKILKKIPDYRLVMC